jgi:hypothetical protein
MRSCESISRVSISSVRKATASTKSSHLRFAPKSILKVGLYVHLNLTVRFDYVFLFVNAAHRAERHSGNLSKNAAKQNRILGLDLNYSRGVQRDQMSRRRGRDVTPPPSNVGQAAAGRNSDVVDGATGGSGAEVQPPDFGAESFPSLGGAAEGFGVLRSGRWATGGHRAPREEDFPSLQGPGRNGGGASLGGATGGTGGGGARRKQQQPAQQPKPKSREEHFPSLGGPSGQLRDFSGSTSRPPVYRDIPGRPESWTAAAAGPPPGLAPPVENKPKKPTGMVVLTKQTRPVPALMTNKEEDFPGLEAPKGGVKSSVGGNSKKNSADLRKAQPQPDIPGLKTGANLKSAVDLILGNSKAKPPPSTVAQPDQDWQEIKTAKPKVPNGTNAVASDAIPGLSFSNSVSRAGPANSSSTSESKPQPQSRPPARDEFPSLGSSSKKMSANFRPASAESSASNSKTPSTWGSNRTPSAPANGRPGFAGNGGAPPGFSSNQPRKQMSSMNYRYEKPADFDKRNKELLRSLTSIMGGKSLEFSRFKDISAQFKAGKISPAEYYGLCLSLVDEADFLKFFPELLVLLPDINKQKVHQTSLWYSWEIVN